jgi:hypothetical protein
MKTVYPLKKYCMFRVLKPVWLIVQLIKLLVFLPWFGTDLILTVCVYFRDVCFPWFQKKKTAQVPVSDTKMKISCACLDTISWDTSASWGNRTTKSPPVGPSTYCNYLVALSPYDVPLLLVLNYLVILFFLPSRWCAWNNTVRSSWQYNDW